MLRLIITQQARSFTATLDGEEIVSGTTGPLAGSARVLLARGVDPTTLITMRHAGKDFDSFEPAPIGQWGIA